MQYKNIQIGYVIIALVLFVIALITITLFIFGYNFVSILVIVLLTLCLILFSTLTTEIKDNYLSIRYGIGLYKKTFPLIEIKDVQIVKQPWYYGWGIRWTPEGWLYRVAGYYAVKIKMKSGKIFFIGSDEPEKLITAIKEKVGI